MEVAPPRHRWAVEVRDGRWLCEPVYRALRDAGAALVIHDLIPDHPRVLTADWVYYRYHGGPVEGNYPPASLHAAADELADHRNAGRDVYVYFNNDIGGFAFHNALDLRRRLEAQ